MNVHRSSAFVRALKRYGRKLNDRQADEVARRIHLFESNWQAAELNTHKLSHADGKWAFTVLKDATRNDRVVFIFEITNDGKEIWLLAIGSHDEVYR